MIPETHIFKHSIPIQIRFSDIDPLNHVNNSIMFQYYDIGRISYFEAVMGKDIKWSDISVVLVNLDVNFFAPTFLHDEVHVETKIVSFGNKSMKMTQQIIDKKTNNIKSTCMSILSGFDSKTYQSIVIPEEFKTPFLEFENKL